MIKYTSITFFKSIRHHLLYKLTATLLVLFSPTLFAKQPISTEFCNQMKVEFSEVYVPQLPIVIDNLTQIVSMHIINDRNKKCIINVVYEVELTKMISASAKEEKINYEDMRNIYNSEEIKNIIIKNIENTTKTMANNNIITSIKKYSNWELNAIYRFDEPFYGTTRFKVIDQ